MGQGSAACQYHVLSFGVACDYGVAYALLALVSARGLPPVLLIIVLLALGVGDDFVAGDSPRWRPLRGEGRAGEYGRHGTATAPTLERHTARCHRHVQTRRKRECWWWCGGGSW
ncbi:hypothetical protein C8Q77DRAFT_1121202 [Trametes polyzona]|nr:hypothetical protein C8Q77DRAFT_1121202 [Trametes polyzona]